MSIKSKRSCDMLDQAVYNEGKDGERAKRSVIEMLITYLKNQCNPKDACQL